MRSREIGRNALRQACMNMISKPVKMEEPEGDAKKASDYLRHWLSSQADPLRWQEY